MLARPGAGPRASWAEAADREQVRQTSAALLTWTVLLLVPVSVVIAVIARPLVSLLLGGTPGCPRASMVALSTRMLVVFAPQILLYGLAVVLYGILQAHRKFTAPALAPVLSSLVVIGAYFWFGVIGNGYQDLARPVPVMAWVVLAVGTTVGVATLVATPLIPVARLRLRLRPGLRFPAGDRRAGPRAGRRGRRHADRAGRLGGGGDRAGRTPTAAAARWCSTASRGRSSSAPYAVLAVPIATSAFPELSARSESFDATSATSTRAIMVASCLGVAGMAGTCIPLARVFQSHVSQTADARQLAIALAAFAPGLLGYGLTGEPVPGALRRRAEPGLGPGGQRRLAAGDRGGPADRAVRAAPRRWCPGSARAPAIGLTGFGRRAAHPGPPVPRPGRAARLRAGRARRAGRRAGRRRGRAGRFRLASGRPASCPTWPSRCWPAGPCWWPSSPCWSRWPTAVTCARCCAG